MLGTVYEMYSPHCNKRYIGSTTASLKKRLHSHRHRKHPLFQYGEVKIRPLLENVPGIDLRKKEGEYIKARMSELFNKRVAGRTQKEKYWDDVDASREYHRNQYTPKKAGGDGTYRQLVRYQENKERILRELCLKNAVKRGSLPSKRSLRKYNFTEEELATIKKHPPTVDESPTD
jgi:hypothetical protein